MNEHAFQRLTITEPSATVAAHPAGDRHAPSTQASWGAIRMTALLAEAVIAMAASPTGNIRRQSAWGNAPGITWILLIRLSRMITGTPSRAPRI